LQWLNCRQELLQASFHRMPGVQQFSRHAAVAACTRNVTALCCALMAGRLRLPADAFDAPVQQACLRRLQSLDTLRRLQCCAVC
jgi:hypothetical protein